MTASISSLGIDMNNPWNLDIYSQLLQFQADIFRDWWTCDKPSSEQQRTLQCLAHALGLEYEYYLVIGSAFISKGKPLDQPGWTEPLPTTEDEPEFHTEDVTINWLENYMKAEEPTPSLFASSNDGNSVFALSAASPEFSREVTPGQKLAFEAWDYTSPPAIRETIERPTPIDKFEQIVSHGSEPNLASGTFGKKKTALRRRLTIRPNRSANPISPSTDPTLDSLNQLNLLPESEWPRRAPSTGPPNSALRYSSRPGSTRSNSFSSLGSERGRSKVEKSTSRASSRGSSASSGFSCFDSRSNASSSHASTGPTTRGPLDAVARAAMKAVKAVGACWRCKILRKTCGADNPCGTCPKGSHKSEWQAVGCRRGKLQANSKPIPLCRPRVQAEFRDVNEQEAIAANVNMQHQQNTAIRDDEILQDNSVIAGRMPPVEVFLDTLESQLPINKLAQDYCSSEGDMWPQSLSALDDCVRGIVWELWYTPCSRPLNLGSSMDDTIFLLRSAALCQAKTTNNQLISQSLHCLLTTLSLLPLSPTPYTHTLCASTTSPSVPSNCLVTPLQTLRIQLDSYLDSLSKVFFLKQNMRNIKVWWLSVFYSLCIQSLLRTALIELLGPLDPENAAKEWLRLPVRLFAACSRHHDPLAAAAGEEEKGRYAGFGTQAGMGVGEEEEMVRLVECWVGRVCVRNIWEARGLSSSAIFLQGLFEDDGESVIPNPLASPVAAAPAGNSGFDQGGIEIDFSRQHRGASEHGSVKTSFSASTVF